MTSRRKLMILTASHWQAPIIDCAHSLGLEVVVTDRNPEAMGLRLADHPEIADGNDYQHLLEIARRHDIVGVVAEQTDAAVVAAAHIAENMRLPGIGVEVARRATNKWLMREACRQNDVPIPRYLKATSFSEAQEAAERLCPPVVIKPVDSQASRGVAKVDTLTSLKPWYEAALAHSSTGEVLLEEMMSGPESSVESFVIDGKVFVLGISEKLKSEFPYAYDLQVTYPARFPAETIRDLLDVNAKAIQAMGIRLGMTHAEFCVTPSGVRLIEIAARGCGSGVATRLLPLISGYDVVNARILQAIGEPVAPPNTVSSGHAAVHFLTYHFGTVARVAASETVNSLPGVLHYHSTIRPGDRLSYPRNGSQRQGLVLVSGASRADIERTIDTVRRSAVTFYDNTELTLC